MIEVIAKSFSLFTLHPSLKKFPIFPSFLILNLKRPMLTGPLRNDIDRLWETFWTGGITNPLTVIEQITYLLFLRRLDENQTLLEKKARMLDTPLAHPIYRPEHQALRWSHFKNEDPETMFRLFTQGIDLDEERVSVFDFMKSLGGEDTPFAQYMKGATFMIATPRLLDKAVQLIDKINMDDRDTKGDLYEYLLSKIASAGQNGQFRTPRHIIRMMVEMAQPTPGDRICDPAAGTAGFLVNAYEYLYDRHKNDPGFFKRAHDGLLAGLEFDASMMRIGAMNLILHGIERPHLMSVDALSQANEERDAYSLILANPPFKGSLDYEAVEPGLLQVTRTKKTELLFLALILRMLRTGGRAAVIVPDGVLFGSSNAHRALREELVDRQHLQGVVSMPSGVFKPYAGVSTAVLFFTRTDSGGTGKVWFYDMQADGLSLDDKRQPADQNDIPDILARWAAPEGEEARKRTDRSFFVPVEEIRQNGYDLSINRYKEIEYEEVNHAPPAAILAEIRKLDAERATLLNELEKMIGG